MRICMFTNTYLPHVGGVAKSVDTFAEDLRSRGHQVRVIAPTYDEQNKIESADVVRVLAVQNFNASDFSIPLPLPFLLDSRLSEFNPQIIHSHHPFLLGDSALRAARKYNIPLIFTYHTRYEKYAHYTSFDSETMRQFVANLSTEYANLCSRVIAPSESIAALLVEREVIAPLDIIPTGVDLSFFEQGDETAFRKKHQLESRVKIIGHVGRLAPEKNLEFLTEAASLVLKNMENVYFLVVGDGPSTEPIQSICAKQGISDRLIMTGKLTGKELASAYRAMDLFIFSSLSETQGMVLLEAMAARTPVVALDAPGAREVVKNWENGLLLPRDTSAETFGQATLEYLSNEELLNQATQKATATAVYFSRQVCANKLEDSYEKALAAHFSKKAEQPKGIETWEAFLRRLKAEWELLSEKTTAAREALRK